MSRARELSKLANPSVFSVDTNNNIGVGSTTPDSKLNVVGIVSASQFYGDGSNLTGLSVDITALKDDDGNIKVQANTSGAVVTGILTATSFSGDGSALTGVSAGSSVVDDTTSDDTYYVLYTKETSGILTTANITSSKLTFNPSTGTLSATFLEVPPRVLTLSPTNGATGVSPDSNIVITFDVPVQKGSGNITLRDGSASGSVIQTIAVSSNEVSISAAQVTINPSTDLTAGKDIYVVVDAGAFENSTYSTGTKLIDYYNFTTAPITATAFNPLDGATDILISSNIVITFNAPVAKGSGNITLRADSGIGTVRQTIAVSSSDVTISGSQVTINPANMVEEEDTYVVIPAGAFTNTDGDASSENAIINTYNFTTGKDLGGAREGGYLVCCGGGNLWIVAPSSTQVTRQWFNRADAVTTANANAGCGDWFVPSCAQLQNPGYVCREYWDSYTGNCYYWSDTMGPGYSGNAPYALRMGSGQIARPGAQNTCNVRAFRTVTY